MANERIQIKDLPILSGGCDDNDLLVLQTNSTGTTKAITKKDLLGNVLNTDKLAEAVDDIKNEFVSKTEFNNKLNEKNPHNTSIKDLSDVDITDIKSGYILFGDNNGNIIMKELEVNDLNNLIDTDTIEVKNDKLSVKSLNGLMSTIDELNCLQGITRNINSILNDYRLNQNEYNINSTISNDLNDLVNKEFHVFVDGSTNLPTSSTKGFLDVTYGNRYTIQSFTDVENGTVFKRIGSDDGTGIVTWTEWK